MGFLFLFVRCRPLLVLLLLLLFAVPVAARGEEETAVKGDVKEDTTWQGTVRLLGDVTVAQDVRLDIAPGTRIVISSKADPRGGWNDGLVELHVHGLLVADGSLSAPVRFVSQVWVEKAPVGRPDIDDQPWLGLVFHPDATKGSELRGCVFEGGLAAVQAGAPGLRIRDCVFHRCSTGVQTGRLWASARRAGPDLSSSAPHVERCRFGDCYAGVTVERGGRPEIERCLFFGCVTGVGNSREGITGPVSGLGPFVDRSLFLRCSVGLQGASRLTNSMFVGNRTALVASTFQRKYSNVTDRVVRSNNLYHENETIAVGDTPVGEAALHADPSFVRALPVKPSIPVLVGSLARTFQVRPSSPALGAATDGGDLGPTGDVGARRPWDLRREPGSSLVVDRWLVAGPPSADGFSVDVKTARKLHGRPPKPGRSVGTQTWAVLAEARDGVGGASPVLAEGRPVHRVAAAFFRAGRSTDAVLVLGLDGVVRAWWGGEALALPSTRRRYDPDDLRVPVRLRKGRNLLLLQLDPVGAEHRFLCRLVASDDDRRAPAGVRLDHDAYSSARPGAPASPLVIESARARPEKGGTTSNSYTLGLRFSGRVHWADVARPRRLLVLESEAGRAVSIDDLETEYKPGTRFLRIHGVTLREGVRYTVRLIGAHAPDGRPLETDTGAVPVVVR